MPPAEPDREPAPRLRRARRSDLPALLDTVGGPPAGRVRALHRLLENLVADVYVLERGHRVAGVVAVIYRRSLAHGGLVATVDAVRVLADDSAAPDRAADVGLLVECALHRAQRRGCVAIDAALDEPEVVAALDRLGFTPVAQSRWLPLAGAPAASTAAGRKRRQG